MNNLTTFSQLVKQFQIQDFVQKTIHQINKDLNGLVEEEIKIIDIENENILAILVTNVEAILEYLSQNSQLQQFIYAVDLNEKSWLNFMQKQDFKGLSEQIIIREAQKVYLRERFKTS